MAVRNRKPRRERDYATEYARRISRALLRGKSRAEARGHPRAGEAGSRRGPRMPDERLEAALKALRATGNQREAAKSAGVSVERFRRFVRENQLARRKGRTWEITDARPRSVLVITTRGELQLTVNGFEPASLAMLHRAAVKRFLDANDPTELEPFLRASLSDARRRKHVLETRPNHLYRLAAAGSEGFEQVYRRIT